MWANIVQLREFYESRRGQVARHMIRQAIRSLWPNLSGRSLVGLGYATPYLRQFKEETSSLVAFMPAGQGIVQWPPEGPNCVGLVDELDLPLPSYSVDNVLLVHYVENGEYLRDMLEEIWRILNGQGRVILVVPNRRGLWASRERTPFGHGRPFSPSQLNRLLQENLFTPQRSVNALYLPPLAPQWLMKWSTAVERLGRRWFPHFAGVLIIEASKQVYAATPSRVLERRRKPVIVSLPQVSGASSRKAL